MQARVLENCCEKKLYCKVLFLQALIELLSNLNGIAVAVDNHILFISDGAAQHFCATVGNVHEVGKLSVELC